MSNLNSPTINKAIGKLVKKRIDVPFVGPDEVEGIVVTVLDLLGYLGVLNYSLFDPEKVDQGLSLGGLILELENLEKNEN